MRAELAEAAWLEQGPDLGLEELAQLSGLPREVLEDLVDCGVLAPSTTAPPARHQWRFAGDCVATVRTASRLRGDFDLDANALALVMRLFDRIHDLEFQLKKLNASVPHHK